MDPVDPDPDTQHGFAPFVTHMEESGEKCTVVFVLIVTEPASERVCVEEEGGCYTPASWFHNNLCKDDSALFSRFLHGQWPFSNTSSLWRGGLTVFVDPSPVGIGTSGLVKSRTIFKNLFKNPLFLLLEIFFFSSSFSLLGLQ